MVAGNNPLKQLEVAISKVCIDDRLNETGYQLNWQIVDQEVSNAVI